MTNSFYDYSNDNTRYDLIISNPPVDNLATKSTILRLSAYNFKNLTSEPFSYLTNSWHYDENIDLTDLIFYMLKNIYNRKDTL